MMKGKTSKQISRRGFIETSSLALAGLTIVPRHTVSGLGHAAPSDKLNIAGVGIAGMGRVNIQNVAKTENIVALCDVDWREPTMKIFKTYPGAKPPKTFWISTKPKRFWMRIIMIWKRSKKEYWNIWQSENSNRT